MTLRFFNLLLVLLFILNVSCSSDENSTEETYFNPHDQNSAKIAFEGIEVPNDSITSTFVSATYCCEKHIDLSFQITQPYLGELLNIKLSKEGELLQYRLTNTMFDENKGTFYNPYFYIPDDFVEISTFNFDPEQNSLDLKARMTLLKAGTHISDNEILEIETEVDVKYFSPCSCSDSIDTGINLTPEIQFIDISKGQLSDNSNFNYYSFDLSSGYYLELDNLTSFLDDYPLGTYTLNSGNFNPKLIFKKYIGQPQTITGNLFLDDDWIDYDIEGQFEILEKLDNGLTRSNLSFTASHEGNVIFEFTDIEMIL